MFFGIWQAKFGIFLAEAQSKDGIVYLLSPCRFDFMGRRVVSFLIRFSAARQFRVPVNGGKNRASDLEKGALATPCVGHCQEIMVPHFGTQLTCCGRKDKVQGQFWQANVQIRNRVLFRSFRMIGAGHEGEVFLFRNPSACQSLKPWLWHRRNSQRRKCGFNRRKQKNH